MRFPSCEFIKVVLSYSVRSACCDGDGIRNRAAPWCCIRSVRLHPSNGLEQSSELHVERHHCASVKTSEIVQ
jgi:hypothetical protein